jgi:hypothetical protein
MIGKLGRNVVRLTERTHHSFLHQIAPRRAMGVDSDRAADQRRLEEGKNMISSLMHRDSPVSPCSP